MVIVRLSGGLGNQMFQYAAGRRLAVVNDVPLKLDLGWFERIPKGDTPRQYELHVFNTIQEVASRKEVKALRGVDVRRWPKLAKRFVNTTGLMTKDTAITEKHYHFDPDILRLKGDVHLDGYWQSPRYFADIEDVIRKDFTLRIGPDAVNAAVAENISKAQSVSIHVRRGDYVSSRAVGQYHGSTTLDYYNRAVRELAKRVTSPEFFVFSDDPEWVKANLILAAPTTYIEHNPPEKGYEDLRLMTLCRHHIIANSSFSWWGAWLAGHRDGMVIGPKKWLNDPAISTEDLMPKGWIRL